MFDFVIDGWVLGIEMSLTQRLVELEGLG